MRTKITYAGLRELINENKMTLKDIKRELDISHDVMARINKNEYVSLRALHTFADFFGCQIGDLIELKNISKDK